MRRRLFALTAPLTALLLLSACSGGSSDGGAADEGPRPGEKVELNFWSWAPEMDKTVEAWNSTHPDIQVTVNKQDGGDTAVTKLLTAIKAAAVPPT